MKHNNQRVCKVKKNQTRQKRNIKNTKRNRKATICKK